MSTTWGRTKQFFGFYRNDDGPYLRLAIRQIAVNCDMDPETAKFSDFSKEMQETIKNRSCTLKEFKEEKGFVRCA